MTASCCWFHPFCHPLSTNLTKLTKTEYKIVVVVVITIFTICYLNYMEKLPRGLKKNFFCVITKTSPFQFFFQNFQTVLFKLYDTLRQLPLPPSPMLRTWANTWPLLTNAKDFEPGQHCSWARSLIFTKQN